MSIDNLSQLKALKLFGMATALAEIRAETPRLTPDGCLNRLIDAELADRQARSLRYQLSAAKFPIHRDMVTFEWQESPLPKAQIQQLASAAFMEEAHNLIFVGGTGTGKTHLATAMGVAAIHKSKRCRSG
jgi:DNA replication protein DnaC